MNRTPRWDRPSNPRSARVNAAAPVPFRLHRFERLESNVATAIDATSNQPGVTVETLPASSAVTLSGTFRDTGHSGFLEAANAISTENPATRDLYIFNSQTASSLTRVTNAL